MAEETLRSRVEQMRDNMLSAAKRVDPLHDYFAALNDQMRADELTDALALPDAAPARATGGDTLRQAIEKIVALYAREIAEDRPISGSGIGADLTGALSRPDAAPFSREGWQPIETAPKDGRWIVGAVTRKVMMPTLIRWLDGRWFGTVSPVLVEPTVWSPIPPLPAPPTRAEQEG